MHHFFAEPSDIRDRDILIRGQDFLHIRDVLRMRPGEVISVSDGVTDREYRCHIERIGEDTVCCRLDFIKEAGVELPVQVSLYQCLPKGDKMEFILQKAVELGVHEVIPVRSARSVVKLSGDKAEAKVRRWERIAEAAAKQSRRSQMPAVREVTDFSEAVRQASLMDCALIPYELSDGFSQTREVIGGLKEGERIAVFIGPEGGFSEAEIQEAAEHGIKPVSLGKRILRTETAALVFLSWLVWRFEFS